ncbi:MAG: TonB-dependent receptor [Lentimicrobiaceae bacterium]|jgi:outer membrane receptor for ferrienterochelin and colicins|nr:TonB-dependent receptor [Lentimicrobiaceae bacterium]
MKKVFIFFIVLFCILNSALLRAENPPVTISGSIMSHDHQIIYATVNLKGTTIGTVTNDSGHFKLKVDKIDDNILVIKAIGYKSIEVDLRKFNSKEIDDLHFHLEEDVIGLNEVVVSSSKNETNRKEAAVIVNTLGLKQLESVNAISVSDGLNFQPGIRVENNCQNCGFQQVRINGLEGSYSQILIDSRPIFSALGGVYGIEQLPVAMIERVEIVRGGGSALFGSNAIAGVVNVITRDPLKNSFEAAYNLNLIGGKAVDRNLTFNSSFVTKNHDAGIHVFSVKRDRDHYDADGDGYSEIGMLNSYAMGFRAFYRMNQQTKLSATYHYMNEFRRGGNKFDLKPHETDITEQTQHDINGGELVLDHFTKNLNNKFSIYTSIQHIKRDSYYGAGEDPNAYGNTTDFSFVAGGQYTHLANKFLFSKANITIGAEYLINKMHDKMPGYSRDLEQDINIFGGFVQSEWKINHHVMLLGVRVDKHNLINDPIVSPRATFMYQFNPNIQARLNLSTGYRAPQAFDEDLHIEAVNGGVQLIQLADDLKPEYSKSISLSGDFYYKLFEKESNLMIEGFFTQLDDVFLLEAMSADAQGNLILERKNGSGAQVYGMNIENRTAFNKNTQLQIGFTLQKSVYKNDERWSEDENVELLKELPRSPNAYGYITFTTPLIKNLNCSISGTYTSSMKVPHFAGYIEEDVLETSPDFFDLNIKFAYKINLKNTYAFTIEAGVKNIFDSYQNDFDKGPLRDAGYIYGPMLPRSYFVALRF